MRFGAFWRNRFSAPQPEQMILPEQIEWADKKLGLPML